MNQPPDGFADTQAGPPDGFSDEQPKYGAKDYIGDLARPVLEGGGAVAGGLIGAAAGPIGAAGGGALGFAGGKAAADLLDRGLGRKPLLQNPKQALQETGSDILSGGQAEAMGQGLGKATKPILSGLGAGAKKLFSATTGVSEPAIASRVANPNLESSPTFTDLSHKLPQSLNTLSNQISEGDKAAWNTLSKSYNPPDLGYSPEDRAIPKDTVQNILDRTKKELSVYGGGLVGKASKQAASTLDSISQDINDVGKYSGGKIKSLLGVDSSIPKNIHLPETTVKGIIQSLDENINWGDETAKPLNTALEKARTELDGILKSQNPAYEQAMQPVSDKMRLLKEVQQRFNIKSAPGQGYSAGTATEANLKNVLNQNKSEMQSTLQRLQQHTGEDYLTHLKNAKYSQEFQPGMKAQGSRRTLFGGAVGSGIGHFTGSPALGGMAGAGAGFMMDTQGGPIASKAIDIGSDIASHVPVPKGIVNSPATYRAIEPAMGDKTPQPAPHGKFVRQDGKIYKWDGQEYIEQ